MNTLSAMEIKRRGMAAIEEALRFGPVHIVKRNKPAAVVMSEDDYRRLTGSPTAAAPGMTALQWLLLQTSSGTRAKPEIDERLAVERDW